MKTAGCRPVLQSSRLLDQVRERIRYCHYSLRTEQNYATTMIYTHVLKGAAAGVPSPLDSLAPTSALHYVEPDSWRMPGVQCWLTAAPVAIYH